jgi:DNA-binding phage protein
MARNWSLDERSDAGGKTRLAAFLEQTEIKPAVLARESGYSRQHLYRLREGTMEPTRICMVRLARACSRRLMRHVHVREIFDIGDDEPTPEAKPFIVPVVEPVGARWLPRLRQAVRASRMRQCEIAVRAGLPEETVSRVLTGQSMNPQLETIVCIAHAIGCTLGWLLDERGYSISIEQVRRLRDAGAVIAEVTGGV